MYSCRVRGLSCGQDVLTVDRAQLALYVHNLIHRIVASVTSWCHMGLVSCRLNIQSRRTFRVAAFEDKEKRTFRMRSSKNSSVVSVKCCRAEMWLLCSVHA